MKTNPTPGLRKRIGLELFRKLQREKVARHELRTLFWECTLRCNLACRHCGSDCKTQSGERDMPAADFLKVIDEITPHVNPNRVMVTFAGGEALLRKDLEQVGRALYDLGYPWGLVTNGMLLDRARLDSLLGAGLHSLTVSLDGFADDHNWMRGSNRSFDRVAAALPMLAAEPEIVWDVVTCVNPRNFPSLERLKEFLIGQGVKRWRVFTIFPAGRAAGDPDMQLTDSQFVGLMEFIRRTRLEGRIRLDYACEGFLGSYETEVREAFYHCSAGVGTASILASGDISGCLSIRSGFHQGNIYRDSFIDVWNNGFREYRDRAWMKADQCASCAMFRYCEGGGMHLRDDNRRLTLCHYDRLARGLKSCRK